MDLQTENTEAETEDGISYGDLNLHEPPKHRTVVNSAGTVQPNRVAVDNSVETGLSRNGKKTYRRREKIEIILFSISIIKIFCHIG